MVPVENFLVIFYDNNQTNGFGIRGGISNICFDLICQLQFKFGFRHLQ